MERKFKIGDRVCVVNGPRQGKVGSIVGYGSSKDTYTVRLSGIGNFIFVEYDLIPQEKMNELNDEKKVLVGDMKNGYSFVRGEKLEELRMRAELEREKATELAKAADKMLKNSILGLTIPPLPRPRYVEIEKVIFNNPATIVFWSDGTKTVVKCAGDETFDEEKGLAIAISKRVLGNHGNYYNEFKKWLPEIDVCEDKGVTMVEACRKAHKAVESFNKAMTGTKRYECNNCRYLEVPQNEEPCENCFYYNSKYKPKKGDK